MDALRSFPLFMAAFLLTAGITFYLSVDAQQPNQHPFRDDVDPTQGNVSRDPSNHSIREGPSGKQSAGFRDVEPRFGNVPASYEWFGGTFPAIGSEVQPFEGDPLWAGWRNFYIPGFDFLRIQWHRGSGEPDTTVTDTPRLGTPCGDDPGDPQWVAFPRTGNVEIPPPFQRFHHQDDCFCRCGEEVFCPVGPFKHTSYRGPWPTSVSCEQCWGLDRIRKHDIHVGTEKAEAHYGYSTMPFDTGYQECLRQSPESFAGSGPGGEPRDPSLYGL